MIRKLTWNQMQNQSDLILSDGLSKLKTSEFLNVEEIKNEKYQGNYLITLNKQPYYIGEGKDIYKRIKQQFKSKTSTFYKNYRELYLIKQNDIPIDKFKIQVISTNIGRKEIEEFGIVNFPTRLNKFQLDKRNQFVIQDQKGIWDNVQNNYLELLKTAENNIMNLKFVPWNDNPVVNTAGIYIIKDKLDTIIYIGESSNVYERISVHSNRTYFSALRRHIGTDILGYTLLENKGRTRYFSPIEDNKITGFLKSCKVISVPICFGRFELEEYLIRKYRLMLNRKENKE